MRRLFDFAIALFALLFLSPLFLLVAIGVKLTSHGPVFFRARRVGRNRKPFVLYKFRSMLDSSSGPTLTVRGDRRVTLFGRLLRRTKIDELPQLLNVLRGDMALVGPRPEDEMYVQYYRAEEIRLLDVKPGITSPASLRFRREQDLLDPTRWR